MNGIEIRQNRHASRDGINASRLRVQPPRNYRVISVYSSRDVITRFFICGHIKESFKKFYFPTYFSRFVEY